MSTTGARLATKLRSSWGITLRRISSTPAATSTSPKVKVPTRRTFLGRGTGSGSGGDWGAWGCGAASWFNLSSYSLILYTSYSLYGA